MEILNIIFNGIQEKDYSKRLSQEVDKQVNEMIKDYMNMDVINISYDDLNELVHDAASIGQYEGFKLGLRTMFELLKELH